MTKSSSNWLDNLIYKNAWAVILGVGTLIFWGTYMFVKVTNIAEQQKEIIASINEMKKEYSLSFNGVETRYGLMALDVRAIKTKMGMN